jgi:uncharacterized membrane protein
MSEKPEDSQETGDDAGESSFEEYHTIADTVGMVPSFRARDNIIQGAFIGIFTLIAAVVGFFVGASIAGPWIGAALFAVGGLIVSAFLSGLVLMIIGLVRGKRKLEKRRR